MLEALVMLSTKKIACFRNIARGGVEAVLRKE